MSPSAENIAAMLHSNAMWQTIGILLATCQSNHKKIKIRSGEVCVTSWEVSPDERALMTDHVDQFLSHASAARERAAAAEGEFRRQWLQVAEMWELLAKEYRRIGDGEARD